MSYQPQESLTRMRQDPSYASQTTSSYVIEPLPGRVRTNGIDTAVESRHRRVASPRGGSPRTQYSGEDVGRLPVSTAAARNQPGGGLSSRLVSSRPLDLTEYGQETRVVHSQPAPVERQISAGYREHQVATQPAPPEPAPRRTDPALVLELQKLMSQNEELRVALKAEREENLRLREVHNHDRVTTTQGQHKLQQRLDAVIADNEELRLQDKRLHAQVNEIISRWNAAEQRSSDEMAEFSSGVQEYLSVSGSVLQGVQDAQRQQDDRIDELSHELSVLMKVREKMGTEIRTLRLSLEDRDLAIDRLTNGASPAWQEELEHVRTERDELEKHVSELEAQLADMQDELDQAPRSRGPVRRLNNTAVSDSSSARRRPVSSDVPTFKTSLDVDPDSSMVRKTKPRKKSARRGQTASIKLVDPALANRPPFVATALNSPRFAPSRATSSGRADRKIHFPNSMREDPSRRVVRRSKSAAARAPLVMSIDLGDDDSES